MKEDKDPRHMSPEERAERQRENQRMFDWFGISS